MNSDIYGVTPKSNERKTRLKAIAHAFGLGVGSATLLTLGGCGGGDSTTSPAATPSNPPAQSTSITGKAIDGYLVNAKVCFDDGQGGCDASLPTTMTDGTGSYTLDAPRDAVGRQINVIVTPQTSDLSNPGVPFNSTFTLSAVVTGGSQNITPLTTLVVSQVKAGHTQAEALQAVQNLTGSTSTDPGADYIAVRDTNTTAIAASMVSHMTTLSGQGPISWAQVQATMNAYAAKGSIDGVQQADINAQLANLALSTAVDAATALADPLYTVNGDLMQHVIGQPPTFGLSPIRENFTLSGSTLSVVQEAQSNGSWSPATPIGSYDAFFSSSWISLSGGVGNYEMKADGTWSNWLTASQTHPSLALSSVGSKLMGTDPNTGNTVSVSYRTMDVSGQPLSTGLQIDYRNPVRRSMTGTFTPGTMAYLATISYSNDRLVLTSQGFGLPWINGDTDYTANGGSSPIQYSLGDRAQAYTAVAQAVGTQTDIGGGCVLLNIMANGLVEVDKSNNAGCNYANYPLRLPVVGSWSSYDRNPSVMTISLPKSIGAANVPINDEIKNVINAGGALVVALKDSKLLMGYMQPASAPTTVAQFRADVTDVIAASMRAAAIRIGQQQNP